MLSGTAEARPDFAQDHVAEAAALDAEERKRLLYVAMTRATQQLTLSCSADSLLVQRITNALERVNASLPPLPSETASI